MENPKSQIPNHKQIPISNNQNSKPKFWLLVIVCNLMLGAWNFTPCYAASLQQNVKAANKLYQQKKLDEALQKYNEAGLAMPDSALINFNMGAALYKKEDYQKAIDAFTKALTSEDKKIEADALYNLGNCKYKLGKLKENTDLSGTVALLRESLDYYKRAVELDQKNTDARFNHEFVERELKVLLDKLKQQQPSTDKQKEQKQQGQEKQGTCPTAKEEPAQGKEQKQQEEGAQEGQSQQEEKQQEEAQITKEEPQQEEQGKELSEEEARALLERYGRDEATPDYMDRRPRGYESEVLKDW
jgi:Ca-activated chloride channel family protein